MAALYKSAQARKPIGTHYLNFATGRPVWQFKDGSSVEAARFASAPAGTGNIPWLLLRAVATTAGSDENRLFGTTWAQRLSTSGSGGVAPSGACLPGDTAAVPYSSDDLFWKPREQERLRRLTADSRGGRRRPGSRRYRSGEGGI